MGKATDHIVRNYNAVEMPELFPRFLNRCPIWMIEGTGFCFLNGGSGAPQAADTVETLAALGVKKIISVGMCGAYATGVEVGEVIAPNRALVEEGTSLHYYETLEWSCPDPGLQSKALNYFGIRDHAVVTTDSVYRQTMKKEALWREKGAVGVEMETSAVFSVSGYLGLKAVALLMISDIHPLREGQPTWKWLMTDEMRFQLADRAIGFAKKCASDDDLSV